MIRFRIVRDAVYTGGGLETTGPACGILNETEMKSIREITKYWLPVVLWMMLIFLMSTAALSAENTSLIVGPVLVFLFPGITSEQLAVAHLVVRKGAHVTEYFILGLLLFRAFRARSSGRWRLRWAVCAGIVCIAYAVSDEFHQSFVATRTASMIDVGIDTAGGLLAQLFRRLAVKT